MSKEEVYKAKQEWLRKVMAADVNHATRSFAWAVLDSMYGDKTVSFPGGADIRDRCRVSISKQKEHRRTLVECGALTAVLKKSDQGDWDNYEYSLNLDWDGSTPARARGTTKKDVPSPQEGHTLPPTGSYPPPHREVRVPPTGSMNISTQDTKEDIKEEFKEDTSQVTAPGRAVVRTSSNKIRERPVVPRDYFFNVGELKDLNDAVVAYSVNQEDLNLLCKTLKSQRVDGFTFKEKISNVLEMMDYDTTEW